MVTEDGWRAQDAVKTAKLHAAIINAGLSGPSSTYATCHHI